MDFRKREADTGHAVCSPSQLYRILACPGSLKESLKAPITPPSEYAQHGTLLHDIIYDFLTNNPAYETRLKMQPIEDQNAIEDALDYVRSLLPELDQDNMSTTVETKVSLEDWGLDYVYGTLDLSIFDSRSLHVIDWKFGSGVKVYAEDNEQLLAYAAGCISKYDIDLTYSLPVSIHIVQPFIDNYDRWDIDARSIGKWVEDILEPGLLLAMSPEGNKKFNPGDKQCRWCPAAMTCRHRLTYAQDVAKNVFRIHAQLSITTKAELADILERIKDVKKYAAQIEKYAMAELSQGRKFPGYKLVAGRSTRSWIDEKKVENWLLGNSSIPEDKVYTKKLLSPAQAEKLDRHLKKDSKFQELWHKPEGKPQMVKEDDKRPEIVPSAEAAKAFGAWREDNN